jgi:hypothetical protein
MQSTNAHATSRRSSRVPFTVPVLVTGTEPNSHFSEVCKTLVVSPHGCAIQSPVRLEAGIAVYFQSKDGRRTMAHIVDCQPMGVGQQGWRLGARLDRPQNFWGLKTLPGDWQLREWPAAALDQQPDHAILDETSEQVSDDHLRALVAELVRPLNAEVTELREKLAHSGTKRSQFDISLSHIPPEVEEKLWVRLQQDLGAQALRHTRELSEQVLAATQTAIDKKISQAQNQFGQQLLQELQSVGQRAQALSEEISNAVQRRFHSGAERFQQQVSEAGASLERHSQELLQTLQHRLSQEHELHRREIHKVREAVAAELSQQQAQVSDLGGRVTALDKSARRLESGLEAHLEQLAGDIISNARVQLEGAVDVVLKELGTRNAKELGLQLEEAHARLKNIQSTIETSVTSLLHAQVTETLVSFGQTMEALAQGSVERWRLALTRDFNSLARILGEQVRSESVSEGNGKQHSLVE